MIRDARFSVKAIINTGPYESLHIEFEETIRGIDDRSYDRVINGLRNRVKTLVENEILEARNDMKTAKRAAERRNR